MTHREQKSHFYMASPLKPRSYMIPCVSWPSNSSSVKWTITILLQFFSRSSPTWYGAILAQKFKMLGGHDSLELSQVWLIQGWSVKGWQHSKFRFWLSHSNFLNIRLFLISICPCKERNECPFQSAEPICTYQLCPDLLLPRSSCTLTEMKNEELSSLILSPVL